MALQKEFLPRHRVLGSSGVLWAVPIPNRVCTRAGCPDRFRPWTFHKRTGTDLADAHRGYRNDDYLYATPPRRTASSQAEISSAIVACLTLPRQHVLMRG